MTLNTHPFTLLESMVVLLLLTTLLGTGLFGLVYYTREQQFKLETEQITELIKQVRESSFLCDVDLLILFKNLENGLSIQCKMERSSKEWLTLQSIGVPTHSFFSHLILISSQQKEWQFTSKGTLHPEQTVNIGDKYGRKKTLFFSEHPLTRKYPLTCIGNIIPTF